MKQTDHWFDCLGRGIIDFWNAGNVLYLNCICGYIVCTFVNIIALYS